MADNKEEMFRPKKRRVITKAEIDFESENKSDAIYAWSVYDLDPKQQEIIKANKDSVSDMLLLTRLAFNDNSLTKDGPEFIRVKSYYGKLCRADKKGGGTGLIPLSDAQLEYIWNNAFSSKPQELAYQLFSSKQDDTKFIRSAAQTIGWLIIAFDLEYAGPNPDVLEDVDRYVPPSHEADILAKIREYTGQQEFLFGKLDRHKKECVRLLRQWLSSARFVAMINVYKTRELRKIFEHEFISAVYDKPDLTTQDVNGFVSLANEYARQLSLESQVATFEQLAEEAAKGEDADSRFNKNISDSLKSAREQLTQCKGSQLRLRTDLGGSLAKRKEVDAKYSSSFAEMVLAVRDENQRIKLLRAAEAYNKNTLQPEIDKVENHHHDIAEVFGVSVEEILGFTQDII